MDDGSPGAPLSFLGSPLPRWVNRTSVTIDPGDVRPYDEEEWRDALVIVEQGEVVLECTRGGFTTFRAGDVMWLSDIPLRRMHNYGVEPTVIVAVSRTGHSGQATGTETETRSTTMTTANTPKTDLDGRFSSDAATTTSWSDARAQLADAEIFWITTVRPDGRPNVAPLISVMIDDSLYFCTGAEEQKARNIEQNPKVAMTTGQNTLNDGLDLVIEGEAVRVTDETTLQRAADLYGSKYQDWNFEVRDGTLHTADGGDALLFEVRPAKGFGFGKGEPFSQTRWTF